MASITADPVYHMARERRFFLAMSLLLIASALLGFGYFQYAGISSWRAPWWVHFHAVSQMGWLGFYAVQNALIVRGDLALHRRLGVFGTFYGAGLVLAGLALSFAVPLAGRGGRVMSPTELLAQDLVNILTFAAVFAAAISMRRVSDWHKRLMLCAVIVLSMPGLGRITVMLGAPGVLNRTSLLIAMMAIGMIFDWRTRGRVHPAYWCCVAATLAMGLLIATLPQFAPFAALADSIAG
jgi:hypothetical protein